MTDFLQVRTQLNQHRTAYEQARQDAFVSDQRIQSLQKELDALNRQQGDNNPVFLQRRGELTVALEREKRRQEGKKATLDRISGQLNEQEKAFEVFIDPRNRLSEQFSNNTPFLLFPLRLETRFKTNDNQAQLWIRVYPDECMVDGFEPLLSQKEVNNATRFWAEYYAAGKSADPANPGEAVLELQKASWALLVKAHGSGRAAWITQQLKPDESLSVFPLRGPKTHILAILTDTWDSGETTVITKLFKDLWNANGNATVLQQIKDAFDGANAPLKAADIITRYEPVNFYDSLPQGLTRQEAVPEVAVVVFPDLSTKAGKINSWTQPSRVKVLPEKLAVIRFKNGTAMDPIFGNIIPYPLPTSPDPSAGADKQFKQDDHGDLEFAEDVKWVADFNLAVQMGLGFRINLATDELNGFDRLLVLGVKLGADQDTAKQAIEELFEHHYYSSKGFSIIPQGTPTNNTATSGSGYTSSDDPDKTFSLYFKQEPGFTEVDDPYKRTDGQWLAEWLGMEYDLFKKVLHCDGNDQSDARNMNTALWPATLGYVMESVMESGFDAQTTFMTRSFFNEFVSGRGPVPAIRIGKQPYGILPTTAFRRLTWMNADDRVANINSELAYLRKLYHSLSTLDNYFNSQLLGSVATITKPSANPGETLLNIIGLHANSVEFYRRYMESLDELTNVIDLVRTGTLPNPTANTQVMQLLKNNYAYNAQITPLISKLLGMPAPVPIQFLIDDVPLSETQEIRAYTTTGKNYITALLEQARKSLDAVRIADGLSERPQAELYRLLKYALEQSYYFSSVDAVATTNAFTQAKLATLKIERPFVHQEYLGEVAESRYSLMYSKVQQLSPTKSVADFVNASLYLPAIPLFSRYLSTLLNALDQLQHATTARLERAMAEHVDCCSYRLDAWKTGLITNHLALLRNNRTNIKEGKRATGIFMGAFGWLENVRPEKNKVLKQKQLPTDVAPDFNPDGNKVYFTDDANEGYVHAPSLNQAVTAAVLRNGYISHGKQDGNNVLAVNLTSERIRTALNVIEGMQGGQSLAALLGYHLERELHDRDDLVALAIDSYIYELRKRFPLNADQLKETQVTNTTDPSVDPDTVPITSIEARNVVHGVNLINYVKNATVKTYPFGLPLTNNNAAIAAAITLAVAHITDIADAIGDLGIAESVHHIVMGNVDRASGVLDSYSKGNYPQEPDVIRTPRSGATLTHRVSIPLTYIASELTKGPRTIAEPSINNWLTVILPATADIICSCTYTRRATGAADTVEISMHDIGLQPIDLLCIVQATNTRQLNEIDDRLIHYLQQNKDPELDKNITINYTTPSGDVSKFSLFEVMPLLSSLRSLVLESIAITPADLMLPNEATKKDIPSPELPAQRVQDLVDGLRNFLNNQKQAANIIGYLQGLPARDTATVAQLQDIVLNADNTIDRFATFLLQLASYGIPQTGAGDLYTKRQQLIVALKSKLKEFIDRWQQNASDYTTLDNGPATAPDTLLAMERLITATTEPVNTITFASVTAKKNLFDTALNNLQQVYNGRQPTLITLIQDIQAIDTTPYDVIKLDISKELAQVVIFIYDQQTRANTILSDLEKTRIPKVDQLLAAYPALSAEDGAKQLETAARVLLGDQFKMIPRYVLNAPDQAELANSWNATDALLDHSITTEKRTNPQEDWLNGIARVHTKMKHLENCLLLREAFALPETDLMIHPAQLPFKSEKYHWMALSFPEADIDMEESNILCYTSFIAKGTPAPTEICGLLADEWNELIPAREETTGITFHYDRPNCEAPQTMLLVTPSRIGGNWQWNDLVDALVYTLDAARSRAIEPDQIDRTPFASLLPAIIAAESLFPYSIVLDNKAHYLTEAAIAATINS